MEKSKKKPEEKSKQSGTSEEKASFDQNGKGAAEAFGQAGSTPNESGDHEGPGTVKEKQK